MIQVGLLGFGTVGTGTVEVLKHNEEIIQERTGQKINVKKILVRDLTKTRETSLPETYLLDKLTVEPGDVLEDPDIDIIVELLGGNEPATSYIKNALQSGKHVVTANKEVISTHGRELFALAKDNHVNLMYEASVAGGIPIIRPLYSCLASNIVEEVYGILNGTTNYMLTEMEDHGSDYSDVLAKAQELGYAESDPTDDVDGHDATRKLAILTSIISNSEIHPSQIYTEGIAKISSDDIDFLKEKGYKIKLLGYSKINGNRLETRVSPVFIPKDHPLAHISGVDNSILVKGAPVGNLTFTGAGAGKEATASAVVADILDIVKNIPESIHYNGWEAQNGIEMVPISEAKSPFYVRLSTKSRDLLNLEEIRQQLSEQGVSVVDIASQENEPSTSIYIITDVTEKRQLDVALDKLNPSGTYQIDNILRGTD